MMNPEKTIEYNSLSWVKSQLDEVLSDAQSNLNEYIENETDEHLENCIEHLQLIYGTLQMVEAYGASMLAEEMQHTTEALLAGNVESAYDTYDVLMRAMLQLPDYLESIQAGRKDTPITLMPLMNDLRAVRKESLLTESILFSPDIENVELVSDDYDADAIEPGKLQEEVKRLRTHYQLGLLDYIRNKKESIGLQRIRAVLSSFEKVSSNAEVRHMWMVIGALVEGLIKDGIEKSSSIKMLLGTVDKQLKLLLDFGENEFSRQYSKELVANSLFYVGLSTVESKSISAVKEAYHLSDLMTRETEESNAAIGGLNADLFNTVSKGITEDLDQVKDVLELFMYSSEKNLEQLVPVVNQLGKIADTYGMLGMGAARQSLMDQRAVLQSIVNGDVEVGEQVVLAIASELLKAESELKDYIAERSGFVDMNSTAEDQKVPAAEYRQVVFTVVSEALKNFSEAKEAILSYVSGNGDKEQLDIILNRLEEVRGVAVMLPLGRVEAQIEKLQSFIRVALLNNNHKVTEEEQDTIADVVTSIEYFIESLSEGRPGVEQGLNAGDEAVSQLVNITQSYEDAEQNVSVEDEVVAEVDDSEDVNTEAVELTVVEPEADESGKFEPEVVIPETAVTPQDIEQYTIPAEDVEQNVSVEDEVVAEVDDSEDVNTEAVELTVVEPEADESGKYEPEVVVPETAVTPQDIEQYTILAADADEEIVEIFIEEAVEVLGELHEYLPQWRVDSDNEEALAIVRRGFHTLKGSGRLLGAEMIGEFSWKFENVLNRVTEQKIKVSEALYQVLDEALAVLPQLIEQLKGNREPIDNIDQLMSSVDAIADGRELVFDLVDTASDSEVDESESLIRVKEYETQDTIDDIETGDSKDVSDEVSISDTSDSDIAEPAAENNTSLVEIEIHESEFLHNDEHDVADEEEILNVDGSDDTGITEGLIEEVKSLDAEEIVEDELGVEPESDGESEDEEPGGVEIAAQEIIIEDIDEKDEGSEELTDFSVNKDTSDNYDIDNVSDDLIDIDPVLLKIYHDESLGHIENVKQQLDECESEKRLLKADEILLRAFHTLYGSARTAEIEPIADLTGAAEKYIRARQDGGEESIPDDVTAVLREIERAVSAMLEKVAGGNLPASEKRLHEKINKIVQLEIQAQLQKSWQDNAVIAEDDISIDINGSLPGADPEVIKIIDTDEKGHEASIEEVQQSPEEAIYVSYGDIDDELIDIFVEEADELLESCEDTLRKIKNEPNSTELIHQLQRNMHTLKGGARMADLTPIGDLTHNLESLVDRVNDKQVYKVWFDLLQESLDALTTMLVAVKNRQPLTPAGELINRIEKLMRGEVEEKRSVERFDVELSELESVDDEELEEIDISELLPKYGFNSIAEQEDAIDQESITEQESATEQELVNNQKQRKEDEQKERPHWGERVTDVNYKETHELVRVRSDLLNNLVNYAGEVNIFHARMGKQIADFGFNLSELAQTVVRLKEQLRNLEIETEIQIRSGYEKENDSFDDNFDPLEMDQYSTMQQLTRSLSETAGDVDSINEILADITRDSETLLAQESRISSDLQEGLMRTRMVRFGGLSSRLRRIVRQVARELGKKVEVEISGEMSEVDRTVLDRIIAPLEHILRNAVAHGIETPEARKILGKNETGKILIDVDRQGADVVIKVIDDGTGIDIDKIRQKAIKQGLLTEDSNLSDRDALRFIMNSGFTTVDEVTQVAGRGVGMDVVDSEIKQLGGVLEIDTVRGHSTEFNIRLPLTLAINQALLVSAADDVYAIPLSSIEGVVRVTGLELQRFYDSDNSHYEFNGVEYELKHLGALLTGNQTNYSKQLKLFPVLLIHVGDQHFALHVEDLIGRREIVVKPVGLQIGSVHGIAGATILADGRVVLILEMSALVVANSLFKSNVSTETQLNAVDEMKSIMVVDDSITIRKITERILKRYGIEVILAKDGVDATNLLQESLPDLMLLDIEMPRMDGFEVASFVRNDERLKHIPIIMITSRTGSKHKEKAMEIGVNQYLGKPFQEDELMKNINKILKTSFSLT